LVTRQVSNLLVVHLFLTLTGQRISACNCIYQLTACIRYHRVECKQTVGQSQLSILGGWAIFSSRIERVLLGE